jgi:hypothetical protein
VFGIPEFDRLFDKVKAKAPVQSFFSNDDVGVATAFLVLNAVRLKHRRKRSTSTRHRPMERRGGR